jgi:hypothetical protein
MDGKFKVLDEIKRKYRHFNAQGIQLKVRLLPPPVEGNPDPISHFESSVNSFGYALQNIEDSDMVGLVIQNENTQKDKSVWFVFRRKDKLSVEVIWNLFKKVVQFNAKFNALELLIVTVHPVKTPVAFGSIGLKSKGRQIDTLAHLKRSIVRVNANENCFAHALVIAIAKVVNDPKYNSYRRGYKILPLSNSY